MLAAGGVVLVLAMMTAIVAMKPLSFAAPVHCEEGAACAPEGKPATTEAPPVSGERATPPAEHHE
ncbi:MAG: hypothetical protein WDN03_13990 [Rhizomicrobium sp.]